ncbi:unnamed protein product [Cylindrotheca closterium]|uniref:DUF6824 domain-containing protein n=1 Tax=Cylindrotheca closterium TaxID=2856 RepID=A0AAD2FT52_9STRA|nr:unnamed protein product [Cylindrotheca closterium]
MPPTERHNKTAMVPIHGDHEMLHNIHKAPFPASTEPDDVMVPFFIDDAVFRNVNESKKPVPTEKTNGPGMKHRNMLPPDFTPCEFDIICSRSKDAKNHTGNEVFQNIIKNTAPKYATVEGKLSKSIIVSQIVDAIRRRSSTGRGFVKLIGGQWYELGELGSREKVSQSLRDLLHGQYRSSGKSKRKMKNEMIFRMMSDLEAFVDSNQFISTRIEAMQETVQNFGDSLSDDQLLLMMTTMNCELLNQLKVDPEVQRRFGHMQKQSSSQPPTMSCSDRKTSF